MPLHLLLIKISEYGLPIDEDELDRLDMNHHKYTLLQGKLFMAPIMPVPQKIFDLGTGTGNAPYPNLRSEAQHPLGIFAIDIAEMFPSASVLVPLLKWNRWTADGS